MSAIALLLLTIAGSGTWDFEDAKFGELPKGWTAAKTGTGPGSEWKIVSDGSKALAQTSSQGPNALFNLCIVDKASYGDVDMAVSLKAITGKLDRGGGLVWRLRDAKNYYIARWNPLEENFRVYKVVDGKRTQLATADVKLPTDKWHMLRIRQVGNHIRCDLDGKQYLSATDDTFKDAGKIGLWTKADAATHFDDLIVSQPDVK